MDKYPYFTDEICINTTKPLVFVHFFILAQQTSLHNGEGETVSYSSPFPCFLQEDWQIKCNLFYLNLFKVIPIKSGHGHFGQNQNKKIISRYVNKSFCVIVILCHFRFWKRKVLYIINKYLYLLYSGGNDIEFQKWHKMTMTQNDTFSFSYVSGSAFIPCIIKKQ